MVHTIEQKPFCSIAKRSKNWTAGLFSTFTEVVTFGDKIFLERSTAAQVEYGCEAMEIKTLHTLFYIRREDFAGCNSLQSSQDGGLGARAFVITGIKTVQHVNIKTSEEYSTDTQAPAVVGVSAAQLAVGSKGTYESNESEEYPTTIEGLIVFAFQVDKLRIRKAGPGSRKFVRGAVLGVEDKNEEERVLECDSKRLEEEQVEDFGMEMKPGVDEIGEDFDVVFCGLYAGAIRL